MAPSFHEGDDEQWRCQNTTNLRADGALSDPETGMDLRSYYYRLMVVHTIGAWWSANIALSLER